MKRSSKKIIWLLLVAILLFSTQTISAKAASDVKLYTVKGHTITVKAKKGKDISKPLNAALRAASKKAGKKNIYTVRVPKGNYLVKDVIHLYGNVCLNLTGSTLKCSMSSGNMLLLGDSQINENAKKMKGYGTIQNIKVLGGTFQGNRKNTSSLIRAARDDCRRAYSTVFVASRRYACA